MHRGLEPLLATKEVAKAREDQRKASRKRRETLAERISLDVVEMVTLRNLNIKASTCKRIIKELGSYEKEVEREASRTANMKDKGADPYDLKQQENVLAESRMMIPDCHKRLEAALTDLKGTLAELEDQNRGTPDVEAARAAILEVEEVFKTVSHSSINA